MRYPSEDAPRTGERNVKLNKNTSENDATNKIVPLLLRIERSQQRWFGHVSKMSQERLPKQTLLAK